MKSVLFAATAMLFGICSANADVILINAFEVPAGQRGATIDAWEQARAFLSQQPGYIDTALHGALAPDVRFELVNIARWESPAAFQTAIAAMQEAGVFRPPEGVVANPALYTVIASD